MKEARIAEVFLSNQGEGIYLGATQVFVRFFGCNLKCRICDTPMKEFKAYTSERLKDRIGKYPHCRSLCLTGGEPLCQADFIRDFLEYLGTQRPVVYLETNGTLKGELLKVIDLLDIIAMDFKLPSSCGCGELWAQHESFLRASLKKDVFVKMVVTLKTDYKDIQKAIEIIQRVKPSVPVVLQPNWFEVSDALIAQMEDFKKEFMRQGIGTVHILPQIHKAIGIE